MSLPSTPDPFPNQEEPPQAALTTKNTIWLFATGFVAFLVMGLAQSAYGPAYPAFRQHFQISLAAVAGISSAHFLGGALGPLLLGALLSRYSLRTAVMLGSATFALGLLGLAAAPSWALALAAALFIGMGFGAISGGFNAVFAMLGAGPSSLLNAMYGIGAVMGPLLALGFGGYPAPFLLTAVLAAVLTVALRWVRVWPVQPTALASGKINWNTVACFGLMFLSYVGIEAGIGNWATTHLRQIGNARPEVITSAYWLALTVGRFGFAVIAARFAAVKVLLSCLMITLLGCLLIALPSLAAVGYVVIGLGIAPIFSTLLAWFTSRLPARISPLMLTAGSLGGAAFPALIGVLVGRFGVQMVPLAVAADALLLGGLVLLLWHKLKLR